MDGLWSHDKTIVLLARFEACGGPYRPIQPIVSRDGGETWAASGPRFDGSDFMFLMGDGPDLYVAGEDIAEGPSSGPFLLVYHADSDAWSQFEIYQDAADLLGVAHETGTGHLLAWVEHIDVASEASGPVFIHESVDGGKTWAVIRDVGHVPASVPGLHFFQELPERFGLWRVSLAGKAIAQLKDDGKWYDVVNLPLPMQKECPVTTDDAQQ